MKKWLFTVLMISALLIPLAGFAQVPIGSPGVVKSESTMIAKPDMVIPVQVENRWVIECYDQYGNFKWREVFDNLVVNGGLNMLLNNAFKSGTESGTWYVGLVGTTSTGFSASDTQTSHASWTEIQGYTLATRPSLTLGTVSGGSVDNSAATASFTMNGTTTVFGAFIADSSGKGATNGTNGLYGEGAFSASRNVINGDILNVTITLTVTASDAMDILFEYLDQVAMIDELYEDFRLAA